MAAVGFAAAVLCILYGLFFYRDQDVVPLEEIRTGATSTIISVEKQERNLSYTDKKREEDKGYTKDEIRWEYLVTYSVTDEEDGKEYIWQDVRRYHSDGSHTPRVGETDVLNYAIVDGKIMPHAHSQGMLNSVSICGGILFVLSFLPLGAGLYLRK